MLVCEDGDSCDTCEQAGCRDQRALSHPPCRRAPRNHAYTCALSHSRGDGHGRKHRLATDMPYHRHATDMEPGAMSHLGYAPRVLGRFGMHAMVPVALVLWYGMSVVCLWYAMSVVCHGTCSTRPVGGQARAVKSLKAPACPTCL